MGTGFSGQHNHQKFAPSLCQSCSIKADQEEYLESLGAEDNEWQDTKVWEKKSEIIYQLKNKYLENQKNEESEWDNV